MAPMSVYGDCTNNFLYWPYDEQDCEITLAYSRGNDDNAIIAVTPPFEGEPSDQYYITETNVTTLAHSNSNGQNYTKIVYSLKIMHLNLRHSVMFFLPALSIALHTHE